MVPGPYDLRLSNAWIEMALDHSIHCYFHSTYRRVACVITGDAVQFMAGHRPDEVSWHIISSNWGDQLAVIAESKLVGDPDCIVTITAGDLEAHLSNQAIAHLGTAAEHQKQKAFAKLHAIDVRK